MALREKITLGVGNSLRTKEIEKIPITFSSCSLLWPNDSSYERRVVHLGSLNHEVSCLIWTCGVILEHYALGACLRPYLPQI